MARFIPLAAAWMIGGFLLIATDAAWPAPCTVKPAKPATQPAAAAGDPLDAKIEAAVKRLNTPDEEKGAAELKAIRKDLLEQVKKQPNDARRQFLLGKACYYLGDDATASTAYDEAIRLAPAEPEYHLMKGVFLNAQEKPDEALKEYAAATKLAPKQGKYWFELGMLHAGAKRPAEAIEAFRKASEVDPKHAKAMMMTGTLVLEQGKSDEAIALFKQAIAADPNYVLAHANLGQIYQNQGKYEESLAAFQAAVKAQPDDMRVRAKVIQNLAALGRAKERNEARAALFDLHKAGKVEAPFYCREQFQVGKEKVMVFEYFELKGDRALRYSFDVLDETGRNIKYKLSLGSYDMTTQIARETGEIGPKDRMFHLDGYYADGGHRTYGMFAKEPTYDETRGLVVSAMEGKLKPKSSSGPDKDGAKE